MTLIEFEQQVFAVAMASSICDIPMVRRLTVTSINLRLNVTTGGFIDAFYNEHTGTVAFTLIRRGRPLEAGTFIHLGFRSDMTRYRARCPSPSLCPRLRNNNVLRHVKRG
jgi:hypothetical protein